MPGFLLGHGEVLSPSPYLTHHTQPSLQLWLPPHPSVRGVQPSTEGASTLDSNALTPGREAGALCDKDLWNESQRAAGPVDPPEMGLSHIFPEATQKVHWPVTDKLMLGGQESTGRSLPLLWQDGMGQSELQLSSPKMEWLTAALSPVQRKAVPRGPVESGAAIFSVRTGAGRL